MWCSCLRDDVWRDRLGEASPFVDLDTAHMRPTPFALAILLVVLPAVPRAALAQRRPVALPALPALPLGKQIVLADDGHPLALWWKSPARSHGAIVLVHGRTWSSLPNFDLHVTGQHLSLMDALAARGFAVYALDLRGYGATPRDSSGWLTPDRADRDVVSVLDAVRTQRRAAGDTLAPALLGYSRGSMVAMLAAQRHPEKLSGLILYGFPVDVQGTPPAAVPSPTVPPRRRTTAAGAAEDFLTPARTPAGAKDAYVRAAVLSDSIRVDWRSEEQYAALDPSALQTPMLLLDGERDPYASAANHGGFFARVATPDRWWVVLEGVDHVAHIEHQRAFVNAVVSFIERAR